jgi:hypothetical protein
MTDTTELVVPRSIPIIFAIELLLALGFEIVWALKNERFDYSIFNVPILPAQCKNSVNVV